MGGLEAEGGRGDGNGLRKDLGRRFRWIWGRAFGGGSGGGDGYVG